MRIIAIVSFLLVLLVNFLANYLPINNLTTGEVSDFYPNLLTPSPITFSIWGLIYLLLLGYIVYQISNPNKITSYFIISCIANVLWILAWHHLLVELSVLLMLILLYSLMKIIDTLKQETLSTKGKLFLYIPFSIYFAWIMVATVVNITALLVSWNWSGFGLSEYFWVFLMVIITSIIGIWRSWYDNNIFYGFVFIWALVGIYFANESLLPIVTVCIFSFLVSNFYLFKKYEK